MNTPEHILQNGILRVSGFMLASAGRASPSEAWERWFAAQTLCRRQNADEDTLYLHCAGLPDDTPEGLPHNLIEQMAWALVTRPECDCLIYPARLCIDAKGSTRILPCERDWTDAIARSGFLAISRRPRLGHASSGREHETDSHPEARSDGRNWFEDADLRIQVRSRALWAPSPDSDLAPVLQANIATRESPNAPSGWPARAVRRLNGLIGRVGRWVGRMMPSPERASRPVQHPVPLAYQKTWAPALTQVQMCIRDPAPTGRVPVWIAMHWLHLGGAEKFVVDLIRALPQADFAIHLTTEVATDPGRMLQPVQGVEEYLDLPSFLPAAMIGVFADHYIRTRGIRLLHIHHVWRMYESLAHIRRFHPSLKVLDTLHIIELDPFPGGFPELAQKVAGPFIDHHHVVSHHLGRFLRERWCVPAEKISVIHLNVDVSHFDPDQVIKGALRARFKIPEDALLVGFVGRLVPQKQPLEFVEMARLLSRRWQDLGQPTALHFLMVGGGPLAGAVSEAVQAPGFAGTMHLVGEVSDSRTVLKDCDVIALPSENEGLALIVYEAMAMATAIVSTDVGGQSELLRPDQLVAHGPQLAQEMAQAVWPLLIDGSHREALGVWSRARILEHHRSEQTFQDMAALYRRLVS